MVAVSSQLTSRFREKAESAHVVVSELAGVNEAYAYAVDLCTKKQACQLLLPGNEKGSAEEKVCPRVATERVIAAPALQSADYAALGKVAASAGITLIENGLRNHLAGIDIAFTEAQYGIADTGTCVFHASNEEWRIATMISEIHIAVLKKSQIVPTSQDMAATMRNWQAGPGYICFITGPSRTGDIERVLTIGAHGPLEFHLLLVEG